MIVAVTGLVLLKLGAFGARRVHGEIWSTFVAGSLGGKAAKPK
jgi:hypothetical protein